jgi:hypothetical protein
LLQKDSAPNQKTAARRLGACRHTGGVKNLAVEADCFHRATNDATRLSCRRCQRLWGEQFPEVFLEFELAIFALLGYRGTSEIYLRARRRGDSTARSWTQPPTHNPNGLVRNVLDREMPCRCGSPCDREGVLTSPLFVPRLCPSSQTPESQHASQCGVSCLFISLAAVLPQLLA